MKPCKAKPTDEKPCPNQVDEGQEYCPYHLAKQVAEERNILSILGVVAAVVVAVVKVVASSKRN